jgi:diphthine synthase
MAATDTNDDGATHGLILVGMGLGHVEGMTVEALDAARRADHRRYEAYTALWPEGELKRLEEQIGPIQRVMRPEVEQPDALLKLAQSSTVALLVVGDPLQATTHVDLQLQAQEAGIPCEIVHGLSITTVVTGAVGLSNYKFGRQTTLTYPYGGWVATSPLETIISNDSQGMHTLALLDLDPTGMGTGNQRPMTPADAVEAMRMMMAKMRDQLEDLPDEEATHSAHLRAARERYLNRSLEDIVVVLCSDMGTPDQRIVTTNVAALSDVSGGRLNCLVFPGRTGEVEDNALLRWR